ncbi:MAG TPA: metalloregulator ArsR/SmtB family transcription factor [Hyphomicrobiales bacterium]|nr:winged helix-turn-helix transcriptional regulator [Rhodobiaceae bacterium]HXK54928.1 metalloregulator ArsR/SmtB family transcription factor [Hyphomicrobiales bacterium]
MQPNLATTFAALGDPTRLAILQRLLAEGERTVGEIAKDCPMSLPAVSRHIQVLEKAGLIERRVRRQWRVCRARPQALEMVADWVEVQRAFWTASLDRLDEMLTRQHPDAKKD